jgi:23S rRNA (guanosine2251-2'-O)-methyltransferase
MKIPLIFILHDIRSMNNVGSLFRTADALGLEKIYLCGITGRPPHREIQKTALGATETVAWEWKPGISEVIEQLRKKNYTILALEQTPDAQALQNYKVKGPLALVLGNEIEGVPNEITSVCDQTLVIEQFGEKKSMNVAVASGIAAWWLSQQFREF